MGGRRFSRSTNVFTRLTIVPRRVERMGRRPHCHTTARRELCSFLSWEISRKEHLCARFFASPRILRRRRAINHKSVTARGKLLESLFPAFSPRVPPSTSFRFPSLLTLSSFFFRFSTPSARKRAPLLIVIVLMLRGAAMNDATFYGAASPPPSSER